MNSFRGALALVAALFLAGPAHAQVGLSGPTELRPGDVLGIEVWGRMELTGEFRVAFDGTLVHPLYREVVVTGMPLPEVEEHLTAYLAQYESNPRLVLKPQLQVAVRGEVNSPDIYLFPPDVTLAQAITMAGGPTSQARESRVRLIRDGQEYVMDLRRPEVSEMVHSGDEIVVPRERNYVPQGLSVMSLTIQVIQFMYILGVL